MGKLHNFLINIKKVLVASDSIIEQTVIGGIWSGLNNFFERGLQVIKIIILARLLAPSDFGLLGIALLTFAVFKKLSSLGFNAALIQRKEEDIDDFLDTTWSVKVLRGLLLAGAIFFIAPFAAEFFQEPRATDIIRVVALFPLLQGLRNPGIVYFRKDLDFHKQFFYKISGTIIDILVAVPIALITRSVWALVVGLLAEKALRTVISYILHAYRPSFEFNPNYVRELFSYGKWLTLSGIVLFLIYQGDDGFVGWFLGASALGFYQIAYRFSNAPATELSQIVADVSFPMFSKLQDSADSLREGYARTVQITTFISFPASVGLIVVAPTFVRAFLGSKWAVMIPAFQILAVWGIFRSVGSTFGPLFQAIGKPDYSTKLQILKLLIIMVSIYPATSRWGIEGTALALILSAAITEPIGYAIAINDVNGNYIRFFNLALYPLFGSLLMGGCVLLLRQRLYLNSNMFEFVVLVLAGVISYTSLMYIIERRFGYKILPVFRTMMSAVR